jgi:hypothetical protein
VRAGTPAPDPATREQEATPRMSTTPATTVEAVRRDVRLVGILLISLIVVAYLPLPFKLAGIAFGVVTVALSIRALGRLGRLRREGGRPRGQLALSAGMGLASVVTLMLGYEALTYPVAADREECLSGAVTLASRERCEEQYRERIDQWLEPLRQQPER